MMGLSGITIGVIHPYAPESIDEYGPSVQYIQSDVFDYIHTTDEVILLLHFIPAFI